MSAQTTAPNPHDDGEAPQVLPYGTWPSPISAEQLAVGGNRVGGPACLGGHIWWTESLAAEGGRQTIMRTREPVDLQDCELPESVTVLPAPFNARTRVHEYGGSCWTVVEDGGPSPLILFVDFHDQRIHRFREGETPVPISPEGPPVDSAAGPSLRWAQPLVVPAGVTGPEHSHPEQSHPGQTVPEVWWICEDHTVDRLGADGAPVITRYIAAVPLDGSAAEDPAAVRRVTDSSRFVAHPRLSPDGRHLAWISWEHPQMPWDGTELHVGTLADGQVTQDTVIDGDTGTSVLEPEWMDATRLRYLSDRSGWWNPWTWTLGDDPGTGRQVLDQPREFGGPLWQPGMSWSAGIDATTVLAVCGTALDGLALVDVDAGTAFDLDTPFTVISDVGVREDGLVVLCAAAPETFSGIVVAYLDTAEGTPRLGPWRTLRSSRADAPDPGVLPTLEPITVTTTAGQTVHAVLYRPRHQGIDAPEGELPPYIAQVHGRPTGRAGAGLSLSTAYYTSRGIGVVDINYGGSSGFGRAYRDRLRGQWGVVDVEDTVAVMTHLVQNGLADGDRLGIEGGSAGGWTTLAALTRTETFSAGVSSFGVADALALTEDTHDFESRYLDGLIGALPQDIEVYRDRAPLHHVDSLSCPVLLLQGAEDPIVPPNQAEAFRDALAAKGIPHAYLLFEGEQHGFRRAENTIASFEASLSFYGQVFGFEPPGIPRLTLSGSST